MANSKVLMVEGSWFHCLFLVNFENEQLILNGTSSGIGIASE